MANAPTSAMKVGYSSFMPSAPGDSGIENNHSRELSASAMKPSMLVAV